MVDILLASYNGEKYVEAQILSIMSQTYKDWKLIIHDDGSEDGTLSIIKRLSLLDERIELIEDGIRLGGAAANFMYLLQFSNSEHVMFCDQDDIWFDNKVEMMHKAITSVQGRGVVAYSNSYIWSPNKGVLGLSTLTFPRNLNSFLFLNCGQQGCAAMFDSYMRDKLRKCDFTIAMHDHILHLMGLSLGKVIYMDTPLMLYRQHDKKVTGLARRVKFNMQSVVRCYKVPVVDRKHYNTIVGFKNSYISELSPQQIDILNHYIELPNKSCIGRLYYVIKYHYKVFDSTIILICKLLLKPFII